MPLVMPATATVILLSLIGGLRSFELIWATTGGGPGFASDVVGSMIYKQYQAGFYGLSTAGNVILFLIVAAIVVPINVILSRREVQVMKRRRTIGWVIGIVAVFASVVIFLMPFAFILVTAAKTDARKRRTSTSPGRRSGSSGRTSRTVLTTPDTTWCCGPSSTAPP